jgi:hypothetical protein
MFFEPFLRVAERTRVGRARRSHGERADIRVGTRWLATLNGMKPWALRPRAEGTGGRLSDSRAHRHPTWKTPLLDDSIAELGSLAHHQLPFLRGLHIRSATSLRRPPARHLQHVPAGVNRDSQDAAGKRV